MIELIPYKRKCETQYCETVVEWNVKDDEFLMGPYCRSHAQQLKEMLKSVR